MKRVFALVLAAMMILTAMALTGCGDKDKKENASVEAPEGAVANTNSDGVTTSFYKNEYDDKGNLTRNYDYNSKGELLGSTAYEYSRKR